MSDLSIAAAGAVSGSGGKQPLPPHLRWRRRRATVFGLFQFAAVAGGVIWAIWSGAAAMHYTWQWERAFRFFIDVTPEGVKFGSLALGLIETLRISLVAGAAALALGFALAIARLTSSWSLVRLSAAIVEVILTYQVDIPCNWLQVAENSMDPMHVVFLHTRVNIVQFNERLGVLPLMDFRERPFGLFYTKSRRLNDEYVWVSTNDLILPNFTQAGSVYNSTEGHEPKYFGRNSFSRWVVPVDDTHTTVLAFRHFNHRSEDSRPELRTPEALERIDIGELRDRPYEERQRNPGDYEVFIGQGAITPHLSERLATSDRGVVMFRRRLEQEIGNLQQGQRPLQVSSLFGGQEIPTYGSDTVIRLPHSRDADEQARRALQARIADIYVSADQLTGDERYDFLAKRLAELNVSDT